MFMFLLAAVLPAAILFWYVYSRDITPEPKKVVLKGFLYGVLATFASTLISGPLLSAGVFTEEPASFLDAVKTAFLGAAVPEETAKLLMLWLLLRKCADFDERYDGIVYAAAVGLGFATFENILYLVASGAGFFQVAISRAFLAVPGHFAFAVVMGYYYSRQHFSWNEDEKRGAALKMWLYPVLLHGTYDTICFTSGLSESLSVFFTFVLLIFCFWLFRRTRNRIIKEAADNTSGNGGFYDDHKEFYRSPRHENNFGKDYRYFYLNGDDSVDEQ